jgi:hypothetical protein
MTAQFGFLLCRLGTKNLPSELPKGQVGSRFQSVKAELQLPKGDACNPHSGFSLNLRLHSYILGNINKTKRKK